MTYTKILVFQYGKVGSNSMIFKNGFGKWYHNTVNNYNSKIIKTHSHIVAKDILEKYNNVLIINIVRLPIDRNLSAFWQSIKTHVPNFKDLSILETDKIFCKTYSVTITDNWMLNFFKLINIDINIFYFNKNQYFTEIQKNNNTFLFLRLEDLNLLPKNILKKYEIIRIGKYHTSDSKFYAEYYKKHKIFHKISLEEEKNIKKSIIVNKFYSNKELENHLSKYK